MEKEMATHSSVLAWRIPGSGGAWWGAVYEVAKSRTRLKRLSSSSSRVVEHALAVDSHSSSAKCRCGRVNPRNPSPSSLK